MRHPKLYCLLTHGFDVLVTFSPEVLGINPCLLFAV